MDENSGIHRNSEFLKEGDVAELANLSVRTLQAWRDRGVGPPYAKFGRAVRYPVDKLQAWLAKQEQVTDGF